MKPDATRTPKADRVVRIEVVEPSSDVTVPDQIFEHYVIESDHPIAKEVLARLRAEVRKSA